jgi:glucokinase
VHHGPGVPPDGEIHRLLVDGAPLEERVSARALWHRYRQRTTGAVDPPESAAQAAGHDVRRIAQLALAGDKAARAAFTDVFSDLGVTLGIALAEFGAQLLVVGGAIARSWSLVEPPLRVGLRRSSPRLMSTLRIMRSVNPHAALIGAVCATA